MWRERRARARARTSAVLLRHQRWETPPPGLDVGRHRTQVLSDGRYFGSSDFSLEFGLIQLHNVSECYFVFPKVYEMGVAPPPALVWAPQRALASERGRAVTEGPDASRVGKSFRPSQWWDTLLCGQASRVAQTSGSRDCDWHN